MFFINVLVVIIAILLLQIKYLPNFVPFNKSKSIDILGMILLGLISISTIYGLTKASDYHSFIIELLFFLIIGCIMILIYYIHNKVKHDNTILPLSLFVRKLYSIVYRLISLKHRYNGTYGHNSVIFFRHLSITLLLKQLLALIPQE